ncbi:MAG: EAL domain-containing protein [Oscillospiraceae bacterium]|nr:EAL domain-containing protein [Oscillospiraceae bacterium]
MLCGRHVYALCTSRIHNPEVLESVTAFVGEAQKRGYSVLVFNSSLERDDGGKSGSCCYRIYDLIPFDIVDLIVMMPETFHNSTVTANLMQLARTHKIPILSYDGKLEDVPSVYSYSYKAFNSLLDHVFGTHKCSRVNLMTGIRGNYGSECMVMAYREALRKYGIPFDENRVGYGDYWEYPAAKEAERFLALDTPEAIVCVNDEMALAVCSVLRRHGLRVPEDVIVTGSDGIVRERCHSPRLTTCVKDYVKLSTVALDTAELILDGENVNLDIEIKPVLRVSESCGCFVTEQQDQNEAIQMLYQRVKISVEQESEEHWILGDVLERKQQTVMDFLDILGSHIPEESCLCLRDCLSPDLSGEILQHFGEETELISTVTQSGREKKFSIIQRKKLIPELEQILTAGKPVFLNAVYFQDEVYGYYAYFGGNLDVECFKLPKRIHTAGNVIGSSLAITRLQGVNSRLLAARVRDSLTGMLNLSGVMKVLAERIRAERHEEENLTMVVIGLNRLRQINSIFGRDEGDQALLSLANAITDSIDSDVTAARIGGDEFLIAFFSSHIRMNTADALISVLKKRLQSYNQVSGKSYTIEVSIGRVTSKISAALSLESMLNEAVTIKDTAPVNKRQMNDTHGVEVSDADRKLMERVLNENLLTYNFQPIVNAQNGQIYAYEALMRITGGVKIPPLMLLSYASGAGRLYEIEWLTYNNVLKAVRAQIEKFRDKKIFVNSIPGHFLSDTDFDKLREQYADILPKLVVEFTEQAETEGEELHKIQARCSAHHMDIAVDDYGTGYSNISNLLRYSPNYVKIDRSLISNIHEEPKKQHFVTNIIDFAHANGFMALAEGVETAEELRAVIRFGADLIQGNYTAVPSENPQETISDRIAAQISKFSASAAKQIMQKTYMPAAGEISFELPHLDAEHYTDLLISQQEAEIIGEFGSSSAVHIKIKDDLDTHIVLRNVHFNAPQQGAAIQLGRNCRVTLEFQGDNRMDAGGILVPESSSLNLTGRGNLSIRADDTKAFAIGNDPDYACGSISIDLAGCLNIISNGSQTAGIGGGIGKGQRISICGTKVFMEMSGKEGVGIGVLDGNAEIELSGCEADFGLRIAKSIAVGSCEGAPKVLCTTASLTVRSSGNFVGCIGSVTGGGSISLKDSALDTEMTGQNILAVGSGDGAPEINLRKTAVNIRAEGTRAMDFGSYVSDAALTIVDSDMDINIQSAKALHFAADPNYRIISGGSLAVVINQ